MKVVTVWLSIQVFYLKTYPSIFVIDLDSERDSVDRVSYSYIDVLTGSVELKFN